MPTSTEDVVYKKLTRDIPKRLAKIRGPRSQRSFARDLGVYQQNVQRYEAGQAVPHAVFLVKLRELEGVDLNWFLTGKKK